ncbi:MAG: O-antigen ligase family protein [Planctomycetia bacterium]|jgi:O-antigen ligase
MSSKFFDFDIIHSLPSEAVVGVLVAFVVLHAVLLACICFFRKQIHPMYFMLLVISTMFYVSPFSMIAVSEAGRWLRVYLIVMTALIGLLLYRPKRLGPPAKVALIYAVFMILTAAKTGNAAAFVGVVYKLIFMLSLIACLAIAHSVRDPKQLYRQLHWFIGLMVIYAANYVFYIATNPSALNNRFNYEDIGVMRLAISVASVAVISMFVTMYDTSKIWKIAAAFVTVVMGMVILLTGSRGPTFALFFASLCMFIPLVKRPGLLISFVLLIAIGVAIVAYSGLEISYLERAIGLETSGSQDITTGRLAVWKQNMVGFYQHPLLGCGFMETGMQGGRLHSSYVQLIAEGGLVGMCFFLLLCVSILYALIVVFKKGKNHPEVGTLRMLPIGCLIFAAPIGIVESSLVYGTNLNAVVLMLGIGYLDWMYLAIKHPVKKAQSKIILVRKKNAEPLRPGFSS